MNAFIHYGYYEEKFETDIVDQLIADKVIDKVIIPRGDKWIGIQEKEEKLYIPCTPDFVESYDINELVPIPRELMENFAQHELIALNMICRETYSDVVGYAEARERILKYIRFWYHFFRVEKIDFFFARYVGQHLFEYVMYAVAKAMKIPTIVCLGAQWGTQIDDIGLVVEQKYQELIKSDVQDWTLNEKDSAYYTKHRNAGSKKNVINSISERKELSNCVKLAKASFSPKAIMHSYLSCGKYYVEGKKRKNQNYVSYAREKAHSNSIKWRKALVKYLKSKDLHYYNKIAVLPDYKKPYIYCALQTVPEIALTPLAGNYDNQILELHMLSYCAEKLGIEVYVKEHIYQHWRDKGFYSSIQKLRNVKLIKTTVNTYELIENAVATATYTGSCSLEGVMRNIPALVFANNQWRALPGSFFVSNAEECCKSIEKILAHDYEISDRKIRAYLKAVELTELNTDRCLGNDYSNETEEEYRESVCEHVTFIKERLMEYRLL